MPIYPFIEVIDVLSGSYWEVWTLQHPEEEPLEEEKEREEEEEEEEEAVPV